ncbi:MAG: hypothetical protein ACI9XC_000907 [Gammaproteobacteria bacterium]|jgi:hypothetical protein
MHKIGATDPLINYNHIKIFCKYYSELPPIKQTSILRDIYPFKFYGSHYVTALKSPHDCFCPAPSFPSVASCLVKVVAYYQLR